MMAGESAARSSVVAGWEAAWGWWCRVDGSDGRNGTGQVRSTVRAGEAGLRGPGHGKHWQIAPDGTETAVLLPATPRRCRPSAIAVPVQDEGDPVIGSVLI